MFEDKSIDRSESAAARESCYKIRGNPSQQEAIRHFRGPCEVIAGPGSGKTFVLVERILFLILEYHVPPSQILVLTFSKAAAIQMQARFRRRAAEVLGGQRGIHPFEVTFGTFHSVFLALLQNSSRTSYSILTGDRSRSLLRTLYSRYYHKQPTFDDLTELSSKIALLKSSVPDPISSVAEQGESYHAENHSFPQKAEIGASPNGSSHQDIAEASSMIRNLQQESDFLELFHDYQQYLTENNLLDFDDMIVKCIQMLQESENILQYWQQRFQFILIDEFQDINQEQFKGIRLLAGAQENLFVVGDDDQSIYGFRGSDPRIMLRFAENHKHVELSVNYRSLKSIVTCGQKVILENEMRIPKNPTAKRTKTPNAKCDSAANVPAADVQLLPFASEREEYQGLCKQLLQMSPKERGESAVIFRSNRQMQQLIPILEQNGILYRFAEGRKNKRTAYQDRQLLKEADDVLELLKAYYRLAAELNKGRLTRKNLFRILNTPERFLLRSKFTKSSYTKEELLAVYPQDTGEQEALRLLCRDLQALIRLSPEHSLNFLLMQLRITTRYADKLRQIAQNSASYSAFLQTLEHLSLSALFTEESREAKENPADFTQEKGVLVITMHSSKGLEFDTVFIPDLNEGIFPGRKAKTREQIEEERRLFYVAITRARNQLHILYVKGTENNPRRPSRFLEPLGVTPWE